MHKLILILLSCALIVGCAKHSAPDIEQYRRPIECDFLSSGMANPISSDLGLLASSSDTN